MTKLSRSLFYIFIIITVIYSLQTFFPSKKVMGNKLVLFAMDNKISVDELDELVKKGADINFIRQENTPLKMAAMSNNVDALIYLIEKGADINLVSGRSNAMDMACEYQYESIIKLLAQQGAKLVLYSNKILKGNKFKECEVKENGNAHSKSNRIVEVKKGM